MGFWDFLDNADGELEQMEKEACNRIVAENDIREERINERISSKIKLPRDVCCEIGEMEEINDYYRRLAGEYIQKWNKLNDGQRKVLIESEADIYKYLSEESQNTDAFDESHKYIYEDHVERTAQNHRYKRSQTSKNNAEILRQEACSNIEGQQTFETACELLTPAAKKSLEEEINFVRKNYKNKLHKGIASLIAAAEIDKLR